MPPRASARRVFANIPVLLAACLAQVVATPANAQALREQSIAPQSTDPQISSWTANHAVVIHTDPAARRGELCLFLHGLGGTGQGARDLLRTAGELGYHALGLTYPNDWSPFVVCAGDPACPEALRREIVDGVDRTPLITVARADSIENRLIKVLAALHAQHPDEGWDAFVIDEAIQWDRITLWGHSQGGGNAAIIARTHAVSRLCTSAPAADGGPGNPAAWWNAFATPPTRCFGFCHVQDALTAKVAFWNALGMLGPATDIAVTPSPFNSVQQLSSSIEPAIPGQYHNSVVIDSVTPRSSNGTPVYKPVWQYMLTAAGSGGGGNPNLPTWNDVVFATAPTFTGDTPLRTDIFAATSGTGRRPLLLWIHGGGWQSGDHNQVPAFALNLRARGITVATVGYRLSTQAAFPAQIHDCKAALRFLLANAALFNIDTARVGVWGSSAGGHLAALMTTSAANPELEGDVGGNLAFTTPVTAGISYFGPTDILNMQPDCAAQAIGCSFNHDDPDSPESRLLGVSQPGQGLAWLRANLSNPSPPFPALAHTAALANPITHIDPNDPPVFIAHGDQDRTVPIGQSTRLRDALAAVGVPHVYTTVAGAGHGALGAATDTQATDWLVARLIGPCPCRGDIDCSGQATVQDLFTFLAAWFSGGPAADFNALAGVTPQDLFDFLAAWFAGC